MYNSDFKFGSAKEGLNSGSWILGTVSLSSDSMVSDILHVI